MNRESWYYRSPAYQEALGFARDASERQLVIVETL